MVNLLSWKVMAPVIIGAFFLGSSVGYGVAVRSVSNSNTKLLTEEIRDRDGTAKNDLNRASVSMKKQGEYEAKIKDLERKLNEKRTADTTPDTECIDDDSLRLLEQAVQAAREVR